MTDHVAITPANFTSRVLDPLKQTFIGKDTIIDLLGIALIAGENCFLYGPPGTAKSALINQLCRHIHGSPFTYLLTRFTEPNEIFGPFDIRRLRDGDLVTNTDGMLPEADVVFLDELLNANSAILNSLLMALNERMFRRGRETRKLPALCFIGASNNLPEDAALAALFDRFLIRVHCDNVDGEQLGTVLDAGWQLEATNTSMEPSNKVSVDDVRQLQTMLPGINMQEVRPALAQLVQRLRQAGIAISDRRAVKCQRLIAASAILCGRQAARVSDLWVLRHIWDSREQETVLVQVVDEIIADDTEDQQSRHPQSQHQQTPDPEILARELDALLSQVEAGLIDTSIRDRVQILAERAHWVSDANLQEQLQQRITELWERLA